MVKNLPTDAGNAGSIPGSGRSPGGNGSPLQYSCLGNPMDRAAWWAIVNGSHRVEHNWMTNIHINKLGDKAPIEKNFM